MLTHGFVFLTSYGQYNNPIVVSSHDEYFWQHYLKKACKIRRSHGFNLRREGRVRDFSYQHVSCSA